MSDRIEQTARHYLRDLGHLIKERALEAKADRDKCDPADKEKLNLELGRLIAFYEVITLMQQQAKGFGIPLEELKLDDIDPDRDLL